MKTPVKIIASVLGFFCVNALPLNGQIQNLHSVSTSRAPGGDSGYTLDGNWMSQGARLKLLNTVNFGPAGTYSKTINITDGYTTSGSLTQVTTLPYSDIFFFGAFKKNDPATAAFTSAEVDSLYNWSKRGGKMIISSGQVTPPQMMTYDSRVLNIKWGIFWVSNTPGYYLPTVQGNASTIFNGPFGNCPGGYQGGSLQGFFDPVSANSKTLATNPDGKATLVMDCNTLDLIAADVDGYTTIGGVTSGPTVLNDQDRFWVNTIAFMSKLPPLPQLVNAANNLGLNASYAGYQWYLNGQPINGAISANYQPSQSGKYYAEVTFDGGCKWKSDSLNIQVTVGLDEKINTTISAHIGPNPFDNRTVLTFDQPVSNAMIMLSDELGRHLRSQSFSGKTFEIEKGDLAKGVYVIKVLISGQVFITQKLMVE